MSVLLQTRLAVAKPAEDCDAIGTLATACLKIEIRTFPKPGLVSAVDSGAHDDMDCAMMERSADALCPYFAELAEAGRKSASMDRLRAIGIAAETAMMAATGGVNTHRGAIFGIGMLCAAAGLRQQYGNSGSLGEIVAGQWGDAIRNGPVAPHSHGGVVAKRHATGGAREEATRGFPSVYRIALPALEQGHRLSPHDAQAANVHALMALIADVEDTNVLYRRGEMGLAFAQAQARSFLDAGGVGNPEWRTRGIAMHHAFIEQRLSPGGCADLLAMALFVETMNG